jgi:hypothetical protein
MSIQFFQTIMGRKFYESDVPSIKRELQKITQALEKSNELKAKEIALLTQQNEGRER